MIVFTVIIGGYDILKPIRRKVDGFRYVCVTDDLSIDAKGWELIHIESLSTPAGLNNVRVQRWVKIVGALKFFKKDTIYIDGSHEIVGDLSVFASTLKQNIAFKHHPVRSCYKTEAEACIKLGKARKEDVLKQKKDYEVAGIPENLGMFETGVMIRAYNDDVVDFCEKWWGEIVKYTHRDQISVTKVLYETKLPVTIFSGEEFSKYFRIHPH